MEVERDEEKPGYLEVKHANYRPARPHLHLRMDIPRPHPVPLH